MPFPPPISQRPAGVPAPLVATLASYNRDALQSDIGAGLTVGIVALRSPWPLPLRVASRHRRAMDSHCWRFPDFFFWRFIRPNRWAGGAFIVVVYGIVERYGLSGLLLSTGAAGCLLFLMGGCASAVWCATCREYCDCFTNGIAVLILVSQCVIGLGWK